MWGTLAGTLVNVREVLVNMALWVRQSSPNFARLRQSSHEGARMLPVHPGICLISLSVAPLSFPNLPFHLILEEFLLALEQTTSPLLRERSKEIQEKQGQEDQSLFIFNCEDI